MTLLAYLLAIVLFYVGSLIANTLYLTIWSILNALLNKPYNNSGMDQFIGSIIGGLFGTIFCLYAFSWLDKERLMKTSKEIDGKILLGTIQQARNAMNEIYSAANMLVSRDTFISTRFKNAVQMDVSDSLWRLNKMTENQKQLLQINAKDVVQALTNFYSEDPVITGLDVSQANPIILANMKSVEMTFANTMYKAIVDINCRLFGHYWCGRAKSDFPLFGSTFNQLINVFDLTKIPERIYNSGFIFQGPTSGAKADMDLRGKLCLQTLGFGNYLDVFYGACYGAQLVSPYVDKIESFQKRFH